MSVCVCACVRASVCAVVGVCVRVRACVRACACTHEPGAGTNKPPCVLFLRCRLDITTDAPPRVLDVSIRHMK